MHGLGYVSIGLIILTFFACLFFLYGIAMVSFEPLYLLLCQKKLDKV